MTAFNGLDLLAVVVVIALLFAAWTLASWRNWNEYRKTERLVERNLWRITGGKL